MWLPKLEPTVLLTLPLPPPLPLPLPLTLTLRFIIDDPVGDDVDECWGVEPLALERAPLEAVELSAATRAI